MVAGARAGHADLPFVSVNKTLCGSRQDPRGEGCVGNPRLLTSAKDIDFRWPQLAGLCRGAIQSDSTDVKQRSDRL